jgi:hypothetical protein
MDKRCKRSYFFYELFSARSMANLINSGENKVVKITATTMAE